MNDRLNFIFVSSEVEGFHFNSNILETNLINIIILIVLLVYVLGSFLKESLNLRQEEIIKSIQESEKRLNEAKQRLHEAEAQMGQAQILMKEIQNQIQVTKTNIIKSDFVQARQSMEQQFYNALLLISSSEQQALSNLTKQISRLALNEVMALLQTKLGKDEQSFLIDTKLNCLGGKE